MKIFKYLKDVVFFNPSMKAFDKLETQRERDDYDERILKALKFHNIAPKVVFGIAICLIILSIAIRIIR